MIFLRKTIEFKMLVNKEMLANLTIFHFKYIVINQTKCDIHAKFKIFETNFSQYSIVANDVNDYQFEHNISIFYA